MIRSPHSAMLLFLFCLWVLAGMVSPSTIETPTTRATKTMTPTPPPPCNRAACECGCLDGSPCRCAAHSQQGK